MPTQTDLRNIWDKVQKDSIGKRALSILKRDGLDINAIPVKPHTCPGRIATIPFLPNRHARSRSIVLPKTTRLVIRSLKELGDAMADPFAFLEARSREGVIHPKPGIAREFPNFHEFSKL